VCASICVCVCVCVCVSVYVQQCLAQMSSAARQIRQKRPSKETQHRQLFRRPRKEISGVETLKKRPRRVILKRDPEKRPSKETQNIQLFRRPRKEISGVEKSKKKSNLQERLRKATYTRDIEQTISTETQKRDLRR